MSFEPICNALMLVLIFGGLYGFGWLVHRSVQRDREDRP